MTTIQLNKLVRFGLIAVIALLAANINTGQAEKLTLQPLPLPALDPDDMGTAFTYQGRLTTASGPASGTYDFKFSLYDIDTGGSPIATYAIAGTGTDTPVNNGLFMLDVDFGPNAFTGYERWMEIAVRTGVSVDPVTYSTLSGRQKINPAPYATFARTIYRKTVVVKPLNPSGTELENGQLLLDTLGNITDASASNRYLLKLEPGIYDIDTAHLDLVEYVDIEGSGEGITIITGDGSDDPQLGTVIANHHGEIRSLTIESTGVNNAHAQFDYATAVYVKAGVELNLLHVSLIASNGSINTRGICNDGSIDDGGTPGDPSDDTLLGAVAHLSSVSILSFSDAARGPTDTPRVEGIYNDDISYVDMKNSSIVATGGAEAFGLHNQRGRASVETSEINIKGDNFNTYSGIRNYFSESSLIMRNSIINVEGAAAGVAYINGIENNDSGLVELFDSSVSASGIDANVVGIRGGGEAPGLLSLNNVKVIAYGENPYNYGVHYGNAPVIILDSHIYATGGQKAIGAYFLDDLLSPDYDITQSVIKADGAQPSGNPIPSANSNYGVYIWSDGYFKFTRDTIVVQAEDPEIQGVEGGVGFYNDGGNVTFENGKINDKRDVAYIDVAHVYYDITNNNFWINNSELYACQDSPCGTIIIQTTAGPPQKPPVVWIGSTLLWGGTVIPNYPFLQCMWVHDENYNGFGWAADGTDPASFVCP